MGRSLFGAWLVALWTFLWGGITLANVLGGVVVAVVLLVALPGRAASRRAGGGRSRSSA
ncbi:MAG: hypothetical protein R2711_00140 [Acidimicrobiales bacterium]